MLFYIDDYGKLEDIPDIYKILVMSDIIYPLNRSNAVDFRCMYPKDVNHNDNGNKRRYLRQIKDNEDKLIMNFFANNVSKDAQNNGDGILSTLDNIVFVCDSSDIENMGFDYMKILRKFIKKKYGAKVFELTYDITFELMLEGSMSEEGEMRYMDKLSKLQAKSS